jgi:hypothetical protein
MFDGAAGSMRVDIKSEERGAPSGAASSPGSALSAAIVTIEAAATTGAQ